MCTFVEQKLTFNTATEEKPVNYEIYIKPTPEKEYYRFRLLWFNDSTERKTPFVERFIHSIWVQDGDKRFTYDLVCPTTPYVKKTWAGNAYDDCPICRFANNNFIMLKESNFKDTVARDKHKTFKRRFQAVIPVYVVSDPVYDANNGKFKVFTITDKEIFDKFKTLVIERNNNHKIFNSENALDFLVRVDNVQKVLGEGTDHELLYNKKEIVQMGFSSKPYDIPAITKTAIDQFPFASLYYYNPTLDDLKSFYKDHCLHAVNDDVDDTAIADIASTSKTEPEVVKPKATTKVNPKAVEKIKQTTQDVSTDEDLVESITTTDATAEHEVDAPVENSNADSINIDDLLNDIGF